MKIDEVWKKYAEKIAANVLTYLAESFPDRSFVVRGNVCNATIYENGPTCWRKFVPRKIATIIDCGTLEMPQPSLTFDRDILTQEKLEELMSGVDVHNLSFASALAARKAGDYY